MFSSLFGAQSKIGQLRWSLDDSSRTQRGIFERLARAAERFLHRALRYLGALQEDEAIRRAVRLPGLLVRGLEAGPNHDVLTAVTGRLDLPAPARLVG